MVRYFILVLTLLTTLVADRTIRFEKGWQLSGLAQEAADMSIFDGHAVIVWAYDAVTQSWQGYAPDTATMQKIKAQGISTLSELKPYQAFWINSNEAWSLPLQSAPVPDQNASAVALELHAGWNLVSLPLNAVVDTGIFKGDTLWKYTGEWQVKADGTLPFPTASDVKTGEGFWVKSESNRSVEIPYEASQLHTFGSKEAMLDYIRTMISQKRYYYYPPIAMEGGNADFSGVDAPAEAASDATSTNVQEAGVDESDILKHDGKTLFFADRNSGEVRMTTFAALAAGESESDAVIDFDGALYGMYLYENRLILLTGAPNYYYDFSNAFVPVSNTFTVTWYDVSDPGNITKTASQTIDGAYAESRLHDGKLYTVSQFTPIATYEYNKIYPQDTNCSEIKQALTQIPYSESCYMNSTMSDPECTVYDPQKEERERLETLYSQEQCYDYNYDENGTAYYYDYEHPVATFGQLIPSIASDGGGKIDYVTPQTFYAPYQISQEAGITTAGAFDAATGALQKTTSFTGYTDKTYASADALYLLSTQYPYYYDFDHYKTRSAVYKFSLDENLSYKGRGFVDGWTLNQYSLSEYAHILRIATTSGFSWGAEGTDNALFTLKEGADKQLELAGELRGLGKAGETIRAVRFIGDKGFVVTFRQTDPFYTIDLSDPFAPKKVGELQISGFSEYLHPVDENRILSVGRDADVNGVQQGLQLQLYDISDFAHPLLADRLLIGEQSTYSEVEHNPRALAYRASDELFGIPLYGYYKGYDVGFNVYQLEGMTFKALNEIHQHSDGWYGYEGRGVLFDYNGTTYGTLFKGEHTLTETISSTGADQ